MRLFIGAWPSAAVRGALGALPRPDLPPVRWTTPERWHLTFRFLGEVEDAVLPQVVEAVSSVAQRHAARTATLGPATTRLGRGTLVVPVSGVDDLGAALTDATEALGRPPANRPFTGHVTVARGRGRQAIPAALTGGPVSATWDLDELAVVRSALHRDGARYETVATVPLPPPASASASRTAGPKRVDTEPDRTNPTRS